MVDRAKEADFNDLEPLISTEPSESDSIDPFQPLSMEQSKSSSSSSDADGDIYNHPFPAVDSADQLLALQEEALTLGHTPPRTRRRKNNKSDEFAPDEPNVDEKSIENDEHHDIESNLQHTSPLYLSDDEKDSDEIEMVPITTTSRKSVRWTDDLDGGQLAQEHLALSYNRKELSYAPKSKIRVGIFSPLQKKLMIGIGSGCAILVIVLFVVLFTVIKPGSDSAPSEPPGLIPVSKGQPPTSPDSIITPDLVNPEPFPPATPPL